MESEKFYLFIFCLLIITIIVGTVTYFYQGYNQDELKLRNDLLDIEKRNLKENLNKVTILKKVIFC